MKPWLPLRIASGLSLFYSLAHGSGAPWVGNAGPENDALVQHMQDYRFDFMGTPRTVWDFHVGFGWIIAADTACLAVVLWLLADLARRVGAPALRPLIAALAGAFLVNLALVQTYFFIAPVLTAASIAACLAWAFVLAGRSPRADART